MAITGGATAGRRRVRVRSGNGRSRPTTKVDRLHKQPAGLRYG